MKVVHVGGRTVKRVKRSADTHPAAREPKPGPEKDIVEVPGSSGCSSTGTTKIKVSVPKMPIWKDLG